MSMHPSTNGKTEISSPNAADLDSIAIVGIGCRFPGGADNAATFWELIANGEDAIVPVPEDRWSTKRYYDSEPSKPGKLYMQAGGFLRERIDQFDAHFFGISPREAMGLDPQQRFLLETTWEALEDAGIVPEDLAGSDTGVYMGAFMLDNMITHVSPMNRDLIGPQTAVSTMMTVISNRLSYFYDFRGPSLSIDTACSSSLVALHQACQGIRRGECSLAFAGGVNIMFRPEYAITLCKGKFLARDGHCKSFDERADGYARAEGAGVVVLKPLAQAVADGNPIYAVIRGTGVNQDGRTKGITVPNPDSQQALIRKVCESSGIAPNQVNYAEAHGTGTAVGDPIEASALGNTFGAGREEGEGCWIGSVKANIGHLEAAAGVAGTIKAALCLNHNQVPPIANLKNPNPKIPFDDLGLRLPRQLETMSNGEGPAYAAVNSFGYGGTNAHALLQSYEAASHGDLPEQASDDLVAPFVLPVSARCRSALQALAANYADRVSELDERSLRNFLYSASVRRSHHEHRVAVVGDSPSELVEELQSFLDLDANADSANESVNSESENSGKPVFVFTGMGPQWWAMGRELMESEPVFHDAAVEIDRLFRDIAGWSILEEMQADEESSRIMETQIAQPAIFLVQAALTKVWQSRGIEPAAIVGHSVGEVAAAYAAGSLSLEDSVRVIFHRSRIQKKAAGQGCMLALGMSEQEASAAIKGHAASVSIAAVNSPSAVTLAGSEDALKQIAADCEANETFNRFLQVEVAYHSPFMDPLLDEVMETLDTLSPQVPTVPLFSTVTAAQVESPIHDANYWCKNIREPVFFARTMDQIIDEGFDLFIEVGPHPVLSSSIKECLRVQGASGTVLLSLRRKQPERKTMLQNLAELYSAGYSIDWSRFYPSGTFMRLPAYPWQRETFWHETDASQEDRYKDPGHALLGHRISSPNAAWQSKINANYLPYLNDHCVENLVVMPAAAYIEAALALHQNVSEDTEGETTSGVLEELRFHKAMIVDENDEPTLQLTYHEAERRFEIHSRTRDDESNWTSHANGKFSFITANPPERLDLDKIQSRCKQPLNAEDVYQELTGRGLQYGPYFQGLQRLWRTSGEVLAEIAAHPELSDLEAYRLHPTLLDACFQSLITAIDANDDAENSGAYVPVSIRQVRLYNQPPIRFWSHGRLTKSGNDAIDGDIMLCDDDGNVFAEIRGLRCQALSDNSQSSEERFQNWTYAFDWNAAELEGDRDTTGAWLVFANSEGHGEQLAAHLTDSNVENVVQVYAASNYQKESDTVYHVRPNSIDDLKKLMADVSVEQFKGVAYLWGMHQSAEGQVSGVDQVTTGLLTIQALQDRCKEQSPRLYVVTRGANVIGNETADETSLSQSPLVGLARVARNEHADLRCSLIDLAPESTVQSADAIEQLADELLSNNNENDVALRSAGRLVHRLVRTSLVDDESETNEQTLVSLTPEMPFEVQHVDANQGDVRLIESERVAPEAREVEIHVQAVSLNRHSKFEVTGVISRVGDDVTNIQPGAPIVAIVDSEVKRFITISSQNVFPAPNIEVVSKSERASLPLDFATAIYGLRTVGQLQSGESILIHDATSGVGLAAIQVAQMIGARVFATADNAAKREYLVSLGADQVMDSLSLDFADDVRAATNGQGVDLILNNLAGEQGEKNASLLAPFGRLIELTQANGSKSQASRTSLQPNQLLASVDMIGMLNAQPARFARILEDVWEFFLIGQIEPVRTQTFSLPEIEAAFEKNQDPATIGRVSINLTDDRGALIQPKKDEQLRVTADGTYLITGGFGGFGLEIAKWLVSQGATSLALVGRRGASTPAAKKVVEDLEATGAEVLALAADISNADDVERLVTKIAESGKILRGIMHTAGVLDDDLLVNLDESRMRKVMAPKCDGAWYLHQQTQDLPLDFFVMFSSVSALIGNVRQGNYVAANLFLDSLAAYRRSQNLVGTSINWGVLADVGMAADANVEEQLDRIGIKSFSASDAMHVLGQVIDENPIQVGVMNFDWNKWKSFDPVAAKSPLFTELVGKEGHTQGDSAQAKLKSLLADLDDDARVAKVTELLAEQLAATLRLPVEKVDVHQPLPNMGIDSLMATELRSVIESKLGVEISTLELMKGSSLSQLSKLCLAKIMDSTSDESESSTLEEPADEPVDLAASLDDNAAAVLSRVDDLDDDQVEALLNQMLSEQKV